MPRFATASFPSQDPSSTLETTYPGSVNIIRKAFSREYMTSKSVDIIFSSLSNSSIKQYSCVFCTSNKIY